MTEEILRVQSRRAKRQRRMQIAQHVFAAILLINAGIAHGANSILPVCEIVAGALLIMTVIRDRLRPGQHGAVAWVELAGAVMIFIEAIERTRGRHHLSFIILWFFAAFVLLLFAIFDAQISENRYLKADDEGFEMRLRLLFRRRVPWEDIRGFRVVGDAIEIEGPKKINFRDIVDRDAAIQWTAEQFRRRGIVESVTH